MQVFASTEESSSCMLEYTPAVIKAQLKMPALTRHSWSPTKSTLGHPSFQDLLSCSYKTKFSLVSYLRKGGLKWNLQLGH